MKEYYEFLLKKKLTPDDIVILYSIHSDVNYCGKMTDFESKSISLIANGYLSFSNEMYRLTTRGLDLLKECEEYFKKVHSKSRVKVSYEDWEAYIEAYREMFPKSNRNNPRVLFERFKWFVDEYGYSWDIILGATEKYLEHESKNSGGMYIKKSMYFIKKEEKTGGKATVQSVLADWCDSYKRGEIDEDKPKYFGDNIV